MTDDAQGSPRASAGALLRAARERQGLHIAALAAAIKVAPRKLDALEHDRYDELPDATFTRALAQTVCRTLKIESQPVLALLPQAEPVVLDQTARTLNTPFRDRPGRDDAMGLAVAAIRPLVWAGLGLLVAAAVVYFVPAGTVQWLVAWRSGAAPPAASAAAATAAPEVLVVPATPAAAAVPPQASAPELPAPGASTPAMPAPAEMAASGGVAPAAAPVVAAVPAALPVASAALEPNLVRLRASGASWVEARDRQGRVVFSRIVQAGEDVGFNGAPPLRVTVGNARSTQLTFRGLTVDLAPVTRENVARLELQ